MAKVRKAALGGHSHSDVVIDTNVLSHSENTGSEFHADSLELVVLVAESNDLFWVLDDNGKSAPAIETSLLWAEYQDTLSPTCSALLILQQLLSAGRVCFSDRPDLRLRKQIEGLVPKNKRDRVVLGAAVNSGSKRLVTNDWADFGEDVRRKCKKQLGVVVCSPSAGVDS